MGDALGAAVVEGVLAGVPLGVAACEAVPDAVLVHDLETVAVSVLDSEAEVVGEPVCVPLPVSGADTDAVCEAVVENDVDVLAVGEADQDADTLAVTVADCEADTLGETEPELGGVPAGDAVTRVGAPVEEEVVVGAEEEDWGATGVTCERQKRMRRMRRGADGRMGRRYRPGVRTAMVGRR